jgi:hypothetical protein
MLNITRHGKGLTHFRRIVVILYKMGLHLRGISIGLRVTITLEAEAAGDSVVRFLAEGIRLQRVEKVVCRRTDP